MEFRANLEDLWNLEAGETAPAKRAKLRLREVAALHRDHERLRHLATIIVRDSYDRRLKYLVMPD